MSDSVDRVFSHAINTVNKIRTGAQKPPAATRLKLYGLYKQAMEGDPTPLLARPTGATTASQRNREKYDAWHACAGLSRTEAKRRYISTLIDTMHSYAAPAPETQELVGELEFVWDQIKDQSGTSGGSGSSSGGGGGGGKGSPGLERGAYAEDREGYRSRDALGRLEVSAARSGSGSRGRHGARGLERDRDLPMRVLSPMSEDQMVALGGRGEEVDDGEGGDDEGGNEEDEEDAEFVDAVDSQADAIARVDSITSRLGKVRSRTGQGSAGDPRRRRTNGGEAAAMDPNPERWRRRVESALVKLTTEVAALREQLESRRLFSRGRRHSAFAWLSWLAWSVVKWAGLNVVVLFVVMAWMRRRKDRRLEVAVRVLLGDAVEEVKRVGAEGMKEIQKIKVPALSLPGAKRSGRR